MPAQLDPFPISDDAFFRHLKRSLEYMISRNDTGLGPGQRGRLFAWQWGYLGRATLDMYRATSEERFLELADVTIRALLDVRDDKLDLFDESRGSVFPSWGTLYRNGVRSNEVTTAGLIALPMLEYASITGRRDVADAAIKSLSAFRDERMRAPFGGYYFEHLADGVVEALNHSNVYGAALVHAAAHTDDTWYLETARGLLAYQMAFVDAREEAISWPFAPEPDQRPPLPSEPMWKAAVTLELPIALAEKGLLSDSSLLENVARSFLEHPEMKKGNLPQFIGRDREIPIDLERVRVTLPGFIGSWVQLDDFHLNASILAFMRKRPEWFPNGWCGGCRAMPMAYAHLRATGQL
jgi:hypothetical protein